MRLSPMQVQFFRHNGFLRLPTGLSPERVGSLRGTVQRHIAEEIPPVVRDRQGRTVRLSRIWDRDPIFRETLTAPEVLDPLEDLLGPNIEFVRNRHNHATLRLAGEDGIYLHRDALQWSRTIATVVFYLEDATVENGCTVVLPGSHLLPGGPDLRLEKDELLQGAGLLRQALPVPMPAGGLLVIDSTVIHGAGENHTLGSRMSMTAGYHSADELLGVEDPRRVLVRGQRVYLGNDR